MLDQEALDQEALDQLALDHEADDQLALDQLALDQLALDQEADDHEAFEEAALDQLAASKTGSELPVGSGTRKASSARFGFGGAISFGSSAFWMFTSPTPIEFGAAFVPPKAVSISAPLT